MADQEKSALPIELITWKDHWSSDETQSRKEWVREVEEDFLILSVGFVVHEDEKQVLLCTEQHMIQDTFKRGLIILKPLIISRERLGKNGV